VLDAFWERTEGLLLRPAAPDQDATGDADAPDAEEEGGNAAARLAAAKVRAVAAAGRLVAFQARGGSCSPQSAIL
jgi:hypothetical protein